MIAATVSLIITLVTGQILACERSTTEVGQIACFERCEAREPICKGDEPFICDLVTVIHPTAVASLELIQAQPNK